MGFFSKIKEGLTKTRKAMAETLGNVFSGFSNLDDEFYDELEECLILADLGVETAGRAVEALRNRVREEKIREPEDAKTALKDILVEMLEVGDTRLRLGTRPSVVLVIGVNGVGKTTTIGKLAKQLGKKGSIIIMDEPTTGLHMSDIERLLKLFDLIVSRGNTLVVIEHHLDVIKRADWIIDIGPDGGKNGGQVVFTGTPLEMVQTADTLTADSLRAACRG